MHTGNHSFREDVPGTVFLYKEGGSTSCNSVSVVAPHGQLGGFHPMRVAAGSTAACVVGSIADPDSVRSLNTLFNASSAQQLTSFPDTMSSAAAQVTQPEDAIWNHLIAKVRFRRVLACFGSREVVDSLASHVIPGVPGNSTSGRQSAAERAGIRMTMLVPDASTKLNPAYTENYVGKVVRKLAIGGDPQDSANQSLAI